MCKGKRIFSKQCLQDLELGEKDREIVRRSIQPKLTTFCVNCFVIFSLHWCNYFWGLAAKTNWGWDKNVKRCCVCECVPIAKWKIFNIIYKYISNLIEFKSVKKGVSIFYPISIVFLYFCFIVFFCWYYFFALLFK